MREGFDIAIEFIIKHEAVYKKGHYGDLNFVVSENVKGDDGGLTKFGIDFRSHPDEDIEKLSYERAVEIYKEEYWDKARCSELPFPLSLVQVDGAVNTGIGQQNKFLQRVAGVKDDGAYGPKTREAILGLCLEEGEKEVSFRVIAEREKFYKNLAASKPEKAKFLDGWLNRLEALKKVVDTA